LLRLLRVAVSRSALWCGTVFTGTLALLYAPFWLQGSSADLAGLRAFLGAWEFNSSLVALVKLATNFQVAKTVCTLLFVAFYTIWFWRIVQNQPVTLDVAALRGDAIFGVFLLCSAVVNPWYALWLLPFVAFRPTITGLTALAAVSLSYLTGGNLAWRELGPFDHPKWVRPLEYGWILAAALFEWRRNLLAAKAERNAG
jgi:hypothetical protein